MDFNFSQAGVVEVWLLKKEKHRNLICKTLVSRPGTPVTTSCACATKICLYWNMIIYTKIYSKIQCGPNGPLILRIFIF